MNLTYYIVPDPKVSFHLVAKNHIDALKKAGISVDVQPLHFSPDILAKPLPYAPNAAIIHPLFYFKNWTGVTFEKIMEALSKRHHSIFGMEVADTTSISSRFVEWANHPLIKGLMLPSSFSIEAFRSSGVIKPLGLVPHGVTLYPPSDKFDFLKKDARQKCLTFVFTEPKRKGWDLVEQLIVAFPDTLFIVKGPAASQGGTEPGRFVENIYLIDTWLADEDISSLYQNSNLLISLHRGGAFEMNCLEAVSHGLPVMATRFGAVLDYLDDSNALLVDVFKTEKLWPEGYDHNGLGATADVNQAKEKLRGFLDAPCRDAVSAPGAGAPRPYKSDRMFLQKHSWDETTRKMIEFIGLDCK